jgi:hypothetical protein
MDQIRVSRGNVAGIGKVKIPRTAVFNYEIPVLFFLVTEEEDGEFASACLHLRLDGYGKTAIEAIDDMRERIDYFLEVNFSKLSKADAYLNLKELSHVEQYTMELWNAYSDAQFDLAARDISESVLDYSPLSLGQ